ncbi:hypothetical protein [Sodalis sp. C49]|uniref:hypothetical protein n=1 Tax=unclassified Sodalis (in: enterobacteria) TaxID=2636512 RepID=UPI003965B88C
MKDNPSTHLTRACIMILLMKSFPADYIFVGKLAMLLNILHAEARQQKTLLQTYAKNKAGSAS